MPEVKEGYVLHNIAGKPDADGWYTFRRVDSKRGVAIEYYAPNPLLVQVPVSEEAQAECLEAYSTTVAGEKRMCAVGAIARFSLHDLEGLFGTMKSELSEGATLDEPETIQARVMAWVPWQGNGGGRGRKVTVSASSLEGLTDEEKVQKLIDMGIIK